MIKITKNFLFVFITINFILLFNMNNNFAAASYDNVQTVKLSVDSDWIDELKDNAGEIADDIPEDKITVQSSTVQYEIEKGSAEWYSYSVKDFQIGGKPKIIVYLNIKPEYQGNDGGKEYRFKSSYSTSYCSVKNASLISAQRMDYYTLKVIFQLNGIRGTYEIPQECGWQNGTTIATWTPADVNDSGYYDVTLYKGTSIMKRLERYSGISYNFAQDMITPGDYMFKVRAVPGTQEQMGYGRVSDYIESDFIIMGENGVEGSTTNYNNQNNNNQINNNSTMPYPPNYSNNNNNNNTVNVGWVQNNGTWYFYLPNGQKSTNQWQKWGGKWYYLDQYGAMKTGTLIINGYEYFLGNDGAMAVGWVQNGNAYYYFSDTQAGDAYGAKIKNQWIIYQGKYFYFDETGVMATGWKQVGNDFYYFYPNGSTNGLYGYMATNTNINGFIIGSDGRWIP